MIATQTLGFCLMLMRFSHFFCWLVARLLHRIKDFCLNSTNLAFFHKMLPSKRLEQSMDYLWFYLTSMKASYRMDACRPLTEMSSFSRQSMQFGNWINLSSPLYLLKDPDVTNSDRNTVCMISIFVSLKNLPLNAYIIN